MFTGQMTNQQCQSNERGWLVFQYRTQSNQAQSTMLQYYTQIQENTRTGMQNTSGPRHSQPNPVRLAPLPQSGQSELTLVNNKTTYTRSSTEHTGDK